MRHVRPGPADLCHGHAHAFTQQSSQTAARHGVGESKAQGLRNILGAAVGDETIVWMQVTVPLSLPG